MIFVARGRGSNVPARADASKNPVERMHHQLFREESLAYAWVSSMSAWPDFMRLETVPDERDDNQVNLPRKNGNLPRKKWGALDLGSVFARQRETRTRFVSPLVSSSAASATISARLS